mgnify:CR=1 FL=1
MIIKEKHHTSNDCLIEALNRLARNSKKEKLTVGEILEADNAVRKEAGLRPLKAYSVVEKEYKPSEKRTYFMRLAGATIIRKPGVLPKCVAEYEDCEGFDGAENKEEMTGLLEEELDRLFPNLTIEKSHKNAALESIVARKQLEANKPVPVVVEKEDNRKQLVEKEDNEEPEMPVTNAPEDAEPKKRGRPKGS